MERVPLARNRNTDSLLWRKHSRGSGLAFREMPNAQRHWTVSVMDISALSPCISWASPAQASLVVQVRQHFQFLCPLAPPLLILILWTPVPSLLPSGPRFVLCSPYQCVKMGFMQCPSLWSISPVVQLFMWQDGFYFVYQHNQSDCFSLLPGLAIICR